MVSVLKLLESVLGKSVWALGHCLQSSVSPHQPSSCSSGVSGVCVSPLVPSPLKMELTPSPAGSGQFHNVHKVGGSWCIVMIWTVPVVCLTSVALPVESSQTPSHHSTNWKWEDVSESVSVRAVRRETCGSVFEFEMNPDVNRSFSLFTPTGKCSNNKYMLMHRPPTICY